MDLESDNNMASAILDLSSYQSFNSNLSTLQNTPFTLTSLKQGRHTSLVDISDTSVVAPTFSPLEETSSSQ